MVRSSAANVLVTMHNESYDSSCLYSHFFFLSNLEAVFKPLFAPVAVQTKEVIVSSM